MYGYDQEAQRKVIHGVPQVKLAKAIDLVVAVLAEVNNVTEEPYDLEHGGCVDVAYQERDMAIDALQNLRRHLRLTEKETN